MRPHSRGMYEAVEMGYALFDTVEGVQEAMAWLLEHEGRVQFHVGLNGPEIRITSVLPDDRGSLTTVFRMDDTDPVGSFLGAMSDHTTRRDN